MLKETNKCVCYASVYTLIKTDTKITNNNELYIKFNTQ